MADRNVKVRLIAEIVNYRAGMEQAKKSTQEVAEAAKKSAKDHGQSWDIAGRTLLGFGAAAVTGVGFAVKAFMDFDKQMSSVKAATHASGAEMGLLREAAVTAGADTAFSAREAAQGIEELAKAGVSTKDILNGGLTGALDLAAAGGLDVAEAAETAATALVQFKLSGEKVPHVADLLSAAAGKAQGSVSDMGAALKQSGLVAASTGLSIEETTGALAAFASAGLIGSDSGTAFKSMLQRLTPQSAEAETKMRELGISAYDAQGNFVGLEKFAGNLQGAMKDLTPEARNAAMSVIFGSDAVRASNVLYEQGAAGIHKWIGEVNDAGYAASTAAIKQDNLAGDFEKLSGSIDSVFLKSGSGANDVLRGLAKGAEGLVDAIGKIPAPLLQTGLNLTALVGVSALVGGGFLTLYPKIQAAKDAFTAIDGEGKKTTTTLGKIGKAAGVAAAAFAALQIIGTVQKAMGPAAKSVEDFAQATLNTGSSVENLNAMFKENEMGVEVKGLGEAFLRVNDNLVLDNVNNFIGDMFGGTSATKRLRENMSGLDNQLNTLAKGGAGEKAADIFRKIKDETDKTADSQGRARLSTADLLKITPEYTKALQAQATALKYKLEGTDLEELALGRIPPKMAALASSEQGAAVMAEIHAKATEAQEKALAEVGLAADGTIVSLDKLTTAMFNSGLISMSARDAEAQYQETLDGLKVKIDAVNVSQAEGNTVWDAAKGSFDLTSESGRAANEVFGGLQQNAINTTKAMAANGATQAELQTKLAGTYQSLYDTAIAFGASTTEADNLARSALGIPKDVPIDVAIQNYADTIAKAEGIKSAVDAIQGKDISVTLTQFIQQKGTAVTEADLNGDTFRGRANGGIDGDFGASHTFAANGLLRQSMIAPGGANITWAEPETGWEAYISGKPGQEARNRDILTTIAPRFGLEVSQRSREFTPSGSSAGGGGSSTAVAGDVQVYIGNELIDSRMVRITNSTIDARSRGAGQMRGARS